MYYLLRIFTWERGDWSWGQTRGIRTRHRCWSRWRRVRHRDGLWNARLSIQGNLRRIWRKLNLRRVLGVLRLASLPFGAVFRRLLEPGRVVISHQLPDGLQGDSCTWKVISCSPDAKSWDVKSIHNKRTFGPCKIALKMLFFFCRNDLSIHFWLYWSNKLNIFHFQKWMNRRKRRRLNILKWTVDLQDSVYMISIGLKSLDVIVMHIRKRMSCISIASDIMDSGIWKESTIVLKTSMSHRARKSRGSICRRTIRLWTSNT